MTSGYRERLNTQWRRGWQSRPSGNGGSSETRIVHLNERLRNKPYKYAKNTTSTTKYNWVSLLPMSLFVQYRTAAYWCFTGMAILSLFPFSPYGSVTVILPLVFILGLGVSREFWEDFRRAQGDGAVNSRPTQVLLDVQSIETLKWKDLQVGDLVRVSDGEHFPADLLLLSSSGTDGVCYVETKNLDGETNLKVRQALECTWNLSESSLRDFRADVKCEGPNASLYTFAGQLESPDGKLTPVGPSQLLLRDSCLQNTGHIWGAAIYTGHDTKVMQNSTPPPTKRSRIDKSMDEAVYALFAVLFIMSAATGVAFGYLTRHKGPGLWYLMPYVDNIYDGDPKKAVSVGIISAVNGLVLYGYLIPIGLYISLDIVRVMQGYFMMQDMELQDPNLGTGAKVKSVGLNEELGQVNTILSDKTGTLTCNEMDFYRCSIAGVSYGKGKTEVERAVQRLGIGLGGSVEPDSSLELGEDLQKDATAAGGGKSPSPVKGFNFTDSRLEGGNWPQEQHPDIVQLFFQILAICHTAIPDGKSDEPQSMQYRAESPDEAALIVAAKQFGFCFYKRTPSAVCVRESVGQGRSSEHKDRTYELLNVLEFNSARKRMSVIVRFPDQRVMLLSKGADSVMMQRVDPANRRFLKSTLQHLKKYADVGLRTLVVAYRELDTAELQEWQTKYAKARSTIGRERGQMIDEVVDEIERNLLIAGGTGVEDKLQIGVPETIDHLSQAGINIWVLTGDKVETAINVGYACSLIRKGMQKIIISLEGPMAREVDERAETENWSPEELNKELMKIVAQQLEDGNVEIGQMRDLMGLRRENSALGLRESYRSGGRSGHLDSQSFSSDFGRGSRRPSHGEGEQELQEYKSRRRQEDGDASSSKDAVEQQNRRVDNFGSPYLSGKEMSLSTACRNEENEFALVIDGFSLAFVLEEASLQEEFIRLTKQCGSILCCRVSPRQKAQVTKLVRKGMGAKKLCLAIGDGANDVGMIQAANVGVGITGVEGAQAAMAADYTIGQFRFLERLLLVHGHWSYRRVSLMILYSLYKFCLIGWIAYCCNIFSFFSGQALFNDWYASFYNTLFTTLPICVVGVIDQDVSAAECVRYPQLYRAGHRKELFNRKLLSLWMLNSLYAGALIFFFPFFLYQLAPFRAGGQTASVQEFGALLMTCSVLVPNVQLTLAISYFTWIHHVTIWGGVVLWYVFLALFGALPVQYSSTAHSVLLETVGPSPSYWLMQLLVVVTALLPGYIFRCFKNTPHPSDHHVVVEISRGLGRRTRV